MNSRLILTAIRFVFFFKFLFRFSLLGLTFARALQGIYAVEDAMSTLAMMQSLVPDYELPIPGRRKNPLFSPRAQLTEAPKNFAVL